MDSPSQNMLLNSAEFNLLMEEMRLIKMQLTKLTDSIRKEKLKERLHGDWIAEEEVLRECKISRGKLFTLYKEGKVAKTTMGDKGNYYKPEDFRKILDNNVNN